MVPDTFVSPKEPSYTIDYAGALKGDKLYFDAASNGSGNASRGVLTLEKKK